MGVHLDHGCALGSWEGTLIMRVHLDLRVHFSSGSRNLERGVQPLAHETHPENFLVATPTSVHFKSFITLVIIFSTYW